MDLSSLKYSDLQKLAKGYGIKANQKCEKLIEALTLVFGNGGNINKQSNAFDESKKKEMVGQASRDLTNDNTGEKIGSPIELRRNSKQNALHVEGEIVNKLYKDQELQKKMVVKKKSLALAGKTCISEYCQNYSKDMNVFGSLQKVDDLVKNPINMTEKCKEKKTRKRLHESFEEQAEPMKKRARSSLEENKKEVINTGKFESKIPKISKPKGLGKTADYWMKVHQKMQDKMESIDEYQKKKNERVALLLSGCKEKSVIKGVRRSPRLVAIVKPTGNNIFVPKVFSTEEMDLNFGKKGVSTTFSKEMSIKINTPRNQSLIVKNVSSNFVRSLNTSTLSSSKPKFDLAASLEKPLTWVPYKGRIKPLSVESSCFRATVKEIRPKTKMERHEDIKSRWKLKRASKLIERRNVKGL